MNITPRQFLEVFFDADEEVCFRVFSDRKNEDAGFKGRKYSAKICDLPNILPVLEEHNSKNRGIFFVVNYGGHEDKDITRINAQFVENDTLPVEEQQKRIAGFPLEPSIIVKTRKSLHVYWLISDGKVEDFRKVQAGLARHFDGDSACVNESRVLRVPGFYHCKQEPVMVECIKFNPELRYTQEELKRCLPEIADEWPKSSTAGHDAMKLTPFGLEVVCGLCMFIKHCWDDAAVLPEHDWYAMITNLAVFRGGAERIHQYSSPYPGYSRQETDDKIEQFYRSGTGPMKCATIAAKGFKCPRLPAGCGCASPAGLAFKPPGVDINIIRQKVDELPVTGDAMADSRTAIKFIDQWLYAVEPAVAEAAIDGHIRNRFSFRSVKALKEHYQKVHRQFKKDAEKGEKAFEIPPWYVVTEYGGLKFLPAVLAGHLKETIPAFYAAESFYKYENGVYREISDDQAAAITKSFMLVDACTMHAIRDARDQWRISILKPLKEVNCNPYLLNLRNGMYDILSGKLKEHSEKYYSTVQLNAGYNPQARCDRFVEFLNQVVEPRLIPLIQEMIGYLLIPATNAQKSFVLYGPPRTGKSTLLWVIENLLLGPDNVSNIPWQELGDRFKTAELFGKLANIFADLPNKALEDTGFFKVITGEDYLMAERKNKNPFKFRPFARLVFSCNEIPKNYSDRTDAFYRRLIIIPFTRQVPEEKVDVRLKDKLAAESEGILLWALDGLKRLLAAGFRFSENEMTESEKERYKKENNNVLCFVEECCAITPEAECGRKELYDRYREYCNDNGLKPLSQIKFNNEIENQFTVVKRTLDNMSRRKCWTGIRILDE